MYRIALVEDDEKFRNNFEKLISEFQTENHSFYIDQFTSAVEFLKSFKSDYDLIFLDIRMPIISGMECARQIRSKDPEVLIVFVTSLAQYAIEGYQVNAFDYLLKPLDQASFKIKFTRILHKLDNSNKKNYLILPSSDGIVKISLQNIIFIETQSHALIFHTKIGDFKKYDSLSAYEEKLKEFNFVRCNSCYLVNLDYVKYVDRENLSLIMTEENIPPLQISRPRKKQVLTALKEFKNN